MARIWRGPALCAAMLSLAWGLACSARPEAEAPVRAFQAFAKAVRARDAQATWALLSSASQQLLTERMQAISQASGGAIPEEAQVLLLQSGLKPREIEGVVLAGMSGERATVEVKSGAKAQRIDLVHESGQWRVDLSPIVAGLEHGE